MNSAVEDEDAESDRRYAEDGFFVFRNVVGPDLVAEASAHIDWLLTRHPDRRPEHLFQDLVADDPFWVRLVSDPALVDIAEKFVGPNVALFSSHYICKPPLDGKPVLWHQDASYWPLEPMEVVSLWLAIDESTPENGCMRVIPGSHATPVAGLRAAPEVDSVLGAEIDRKIDSSAAVDLVLAPGDVSVHHPNLVHGSKPNLSPRRRAGLTIRYIPTSTRVTEDHWPTFLLRGQAVPGTNAYLSPPPYSAGDHMWFDGANAAD